MCSDSVLEAMNDRTCVIPICLSAMLMHWVPDLRMPMFCNRSKDLMQEESIRRKLMVCISSAVLFGGFIFQSACAATPWLDDLYNYDHRYFRFYATFDDSAADRQVIADPREASMRGAMVVLLFVHQPKVKFAPSLAPPLRCRCSPASRCLLCCLWTESIISRTESLVEISLLC